MHAKHLAHLMAGGLLLLAGAAAPAAADDTEAICAEAKQQFAEMAFEKAPPNTVDVLMYKYRFCPPKLTVKAGTAVRFLNVEKRTSHSVWFKEAGKKESDRLFPEEGITITLQDPGTYPYLCGPHWETQNMVGELTVTP
ncbi:MAG: cupredoxin domain-containing protein [Hyphomicrobiales bacterium]|nr:cupredoxin domain-containing protein [Hyphomicrobiales bacterium]